MKIVGLVGGVASGKSLVAELLAAHGACVLNVDRLGHLVLAEPDVQAALRHRWGSAVFALDGTVDRGSVARRVFAEPPDGPRELEFLEQLTHPRIGHRIRADLESCERSGKVVAVLDAALLLKAGWDRWCDWVVFVDAPVQQRRDRAAQRGWSEREFVTREAAQGPLEMKRHRAEWVLDNSGTVAQLTAQVDRLWASLVEPGLARASLLLPPAKG